MAPPRQLHGWKDIAGYLGRGVRAAQRWEKDLGLPVHRLPTQSGHAVYAIPEELDAWRAEAERRHAEAFAPHGRDDEPVVSGDEGIETEPFSAVRPPELPATPPVTEAAVTRPRARRRFAAVFAAACALVGVLVIGLALSPSSGSAPVPFDLATSPAIDSGPWPVIGADARRSFQGRLAGPRQSPAVRVLFDAGDSYVIGGRHAVATSIGTFIVGTCDGRIVAFDADGHIHWTQRLDRRDNPEAATALAASASLLLVAVGDCPHARYANARTQFTALNMNTGDVVFRHRSAAQMVAPLVARDGAIYQSDQYNTLRKYDAMGAVVWTLDFPGFGLRSPIQAANGNLLVVSDGALFGQSSRYVVSVDGRVLWSGGDGFLDEPSLLADGDLVTADHAISLGGVKTAVPSIRRFTASGREVWRVAIPEGFAPQGGVELATPSNGDILVRSATHLVAIASDGSTRWRTPLPSALGAPGPVVDRHGDIYLAIGGGVMAFDANGAPKWRVALPRRDAAVPPDDEAVGTSERVIIGGDGLLLVVADHRVFAVQ